MRATWAAGICETMPLAWPIRERARVFAAARDWPAVTDYGRLLGDAAPVRFQAQRPSGRGRARRARDAERASYDSHVCERGVIPTRAGNWHDFFNALVWAAFPRAKRALHARQYRAQRQRARDAIEGRRTREQDGLALVDEGAVVLLCADRAFAGVCAALEARSPDAIAMNVANGDALGVIYGHAIYEHLATKPTAAVRAMVHAAPCARVPDDAARCVALADEALSMTLSDPRSFLDPTAFRSLDVSVELLGRRD